MVGQKKTVIIGVEYPVHYRAVQEGLVRTWSRPALPSPSSLVWLFLLWISSSTAFAQTPSADPLHSELSSILQKQAKNWNEGNIEQFMGAYWKDDRLSFASGGTLTRGWKATLERYKKSYPDAATMGKLTFSQLETQSIGTNAALMLGRWKLDRKEPAEGNFSLVWQRIDGNWVIVHDHSSEEKSTETK